MREIISGLTFGETPGVSLYLVQQAHHAGQPQLVLLGSDGFGRRTLLAHLTSLSPHRLVDDEVYILNTYLDWFLAQGFAYAPETKGRKATKLLLKDPFRGWFLAEHINLLEEPALPAHQFPMPTKGD